MPFQNHALCMDMTVLERQQSRYFQWLHQQNNSVNPISPSFESCPVPQFIDFSDDAAVVDWKRKPERYLGSSVLPNYDHLSMAGMEFVGNKMDFVQAEVATTSCLEIDHCLSRTSSCQKGVSGVTEMEKEVILVKEAREDALVENMKSIHGGESSNKRKVEFVVSEDNKIEEESQMKSKAKEKNCREISAYSSPEKPDYIHVRARRGQATDSHSLAERARREKISKKMKHLQDLVPGCNKITGRAGMLDEIINYVQSLQRQVEFLSMKLGALTQRLEPSTDIFSLREISAYAASFPTATLPSGISNLPHHQLNVVQQEYTGSEHEGLTNPPQIAPERTTTNSSTFISAQYLDSSCFPHVRTFLDGDFQNFHNMGFH